MFSFENFFALIFDIKNKLPNFVEWFIDINLYYKIE